MSRIGIQPVTIEEGVTVVVSNGATTCTGPKGESVVNIPEGIVVEVKDNEVIVGRDNEDKQTRSLHGTIRSLIANAIAGVKDGYEKKLELVGVGYRAKMEGKGVSMNLGLNHPVTFDEIEGIEFDVPDETTIVVKGVSKQLVGEVAAKIRSVKKPEPYKGKGIRYEGEQVRRKSRKVATAA